MPSNLLKKQIKKYLDLYIADGKASVCTVNELYHTGNGQSVFICDEFDFMMEKSPAKFAVNHKNELTLFGLAPVFHAKKTYLTSATCDKYQKKLLRQVFEI